MSDHQPWEAGPNSAALTKRVAVWPFSAMTPEERANPSTFGPAERARVAAAVQCSKQKVWRTPRTPPTIPPCKRVYACRGLSSLTDCGLLLFFSVFCSCGADGEARPVVKI